jgi:hypothetical protein
MKNNYGISRMLEINLLYFIFWRIHTLNISSDEIRTPELNAGDWCMYLSIRRYSKGIGITKHLRLSSSIRRIVRVDNKISLIRIETEFKNWLHNIFDIIICIK